MTTTFLRAAALTAACLAAAGCETIKPFEKEHLLDPLMSDERVTNLSPALMSAQAARLERLATSSGGAAGTACPTCGG